MQLPDTAGVMILGGAILFPDARLPLFIFEPRYRTMLAEAIDTHRMFCVALRRPETTRESPLPVAGLGLIRAAVRNPGGTSNLVLQGVARVRLGKVIRYRPYRVHQIHPLERETRPSLVIDALRARLLDLVDARLRQGQAVPLDLIRQLAGGTAAGGATSIEDFLRALERVEDPGHLADLVALMLLTNPLARQVILQAIEIEERLKHLVHFLLAEVSRSRKEGGGSPKA